MSLGPKASKNRIRYSMRQKDVVYTLRRGAKVGQRTTEMLGEWCAVLDMPQPQNLS